LGQPADGFFFASDLFIAAFQFSLSLKSLGFGPGMAAFLTGLGSFTIFLTFDFDAENAADFL
jgi:hypothetical protein